MIKWRLISTSKSPKGLAIGFLIGSQVDKSLIQALPGWAIVATDQAPLSVSSADLIAARTLAKCAASTPVGLLAWSGGWQSLRSVLLSKLIKPWAVAVFDGTHAESPPENQPWKIQIVADLVEQARREEIRFTATATQMTYTKDLPVGKGRAWPTSWVLGRALGGTDECLTVGQPVIDGNLYVELFPCPSVPRTPAEWDAAAQAHRDQVNIVAPRLLEAFWGADTSSQGVKPSPTVDLWLDPSRSLGDRFACWMESEWMHHYQESPAGSNDSPRIREYDQTPFQRDTNHDGIEDPISAPKSAWCAKMAGAGLYASALKGDVLPTLRVSGIEYQKDAEQMGTWVPIGSRLPARGWLAIFRRPARIGIVMSQ
jgi:hypothetical protein